jgi:S1-C subfamily serine protease
MAIGNPFGLGGSVTLGIISARNRNINSGPYDDFIQTDAAINRGNSGGPLFDMNGNVVGVNTAIISPTGGSIGIGFAIPTAIAQNVIEQLVEFGVTRRGWLGVRIQRRPRRGRGRRAGVAGGDSVAAPSRRDGAGAGAVVAIGLRRPRQPVLRQLVSRASRAHTAATGVAFIRSA